MLEATKMVRDLERGLFIGTTDNCFKAFGKMG
jgi:hypothetical protein